MQEKQRYVIRNIRGRFTVDELTSLAASLIKCGYAARIKCEVKPGTKVKETVIEYWEENDGKA
jgi:hypothetical protein